jgi:hypothetical protein
VAWVEAKQRSQLQKTNTQHLLILSHTNTSLTLFLTAPPDPKTQHNVVKLQLHLQPVKRRKPGLGPRQQQRHRTPARQQHQRTRHRASVPTDAERQPGDSAQHQGHNPPRARQSDRPGHTVRHERSEHTRCRHPPRSPSPYSSSRTPALTRCRSNPEHARHSYHGYHRNSLTTR